MATKNYRRIYEEYYGIKIPEGFIIHHIDSNRDNNNISNLLMLPKTLHSRYHFYLTSFSIDYCKLDMSLMYNLQALEGLASAVSDCAKWIVKKNNMDNEKMWRELNESNNKTY